MKAHIKVRASQFKDVFVIKAHGRMDVVVSGRQLANLPAYREELERCGYDASLRSLLKAVVIK